VYKKYYNDIENMYSKYIQNVFKSNKLFLVTSCFVCDYVSIDELLTHLQIWKKTSILFTYFIDCTLWESCTAGRPIHNSRALPDKYRKDVFLILSSVLG